MVKFRHKGLSLVELLAALVVVSVLVSLAAPSFSQMMAEQRLRQVASELRVSLAAARSEAVKRNELVSLVKQGDAWSRGWCVETGTATSCSAAPVQAFNVAAINVTVAKDNSVSGTPVGFNAWGRVSACPKFSITTTVAGATCGVCLVVSTDGRVSSFSGECPNECGGPSVESAWVGACS